MKKEKKIKNYYQNFPKFLHFKCINFVFGWVDFRGDGKYRKENLSFPLFGNEGKIGGVENQGENFLLGPTKFFLPNWEEKQ